MPQFLREPAWFVTVWMPFMVPAFEVFVIGRVFLYRM